jgi:hypothetical protein
MCGAPTPTSAPCGCGTAKFSLDRSRERGLPVVEVRRYDESGAIEESGTWVRIEKNSWQRCNE